MKYIITSQDSIDKHEVGAKAYNLAVCEASDIPIPEWVVIPTSILQKQLPRDESYDVVKEKFDTLVVDDELMNEVAEVFGSEYRSKWYAVRSSAVDEDSEEFSYAGQYESFLYVRYKELPEKIIAVWKSVVSDRISAYRKSNHLDQSTDIAVIIQEMVPADVSGVAFGIDPVSGDVNRKVVTSVYGLGEGIVSGNLSADTYTIHSEGINEQLSKKSHKYIPHKSASGLQKVTVEEDKQSMATLSSSQVKEVGELLEVLKEKFGEAQDIEFAYHNDQLYLLQSRPITGKSKHEEKGDYILWDNSNIVESYPGVTTPLTFSFIEKMYDQVYRQVSLLMGVKEREIEKNADVFANTLGLVRGRVYYNLLNWYKILAMLPGYSINAGFMENMMGVKESFDLDDDQQMTKGMAWFRIMLMVVKMTYLNFSLPRKRREFKAHLDSVMSAYHQIDFEQKTPREIIELYQKFQDSLLLRWKAPIINDFFTMIWFGLLEKQCQKHCPTEENLHNNLLCGSNDIISVEPIHRTLEIVNDIRKNEEALRLFVEKDHKACWNILKEGEFPEIKSMIDRYLEDFGERCIGELKLESASYSQEPTLYIRLLSSYIEKDVRLKENSNIEQKIREEAEQKMKLALRNKPLARWWYHFVLDKARDMVSNRENLRYERTRGFGMVRKMFFELGKKWQKEGHIEKVKDIFYLKLDEVLATEKTGFKKQNKEKIEERKAIFQAYKDQKPPQERFYTYGKNFTDEYIYSEEKMEAIEGDLSGIGCCPGIVEGAVRVVMDPESIDSLDGDILVTTSTDPGWVKLFPTASAIVVERGSVLSHSAIVSREMGIPCIVGVTGLVRTLKTGDRIKIDGSSGMIKRLSS